MRYIICNGDEGDPGAFMDRMLLESVPYRIIEGMVSVKMIVDLVTQFGQLLFDIVWHSFLCRSGEAPFARCGVNMFPVTHSPGVTDPASSARLYDDLVY